MTPAQYGAASILTVSALLLVMIVAAPLEPLVFRASARGGEDAPGIIRASGIYCYALLPVLVAVMAAGVAMFMPKLFEVPGPVWAIELLAVGFQPAATYFAIPLLRARHHLRRFVVLALTSVLVTTVSKLLLIVVWGLGVLGWAIADLVTAALSAVVAVALVRLPRVPVTAGHIRTVAAFAIPLIPHRASFWALSSLSRPVMATVSTLAQVGLLSFGLNLALIAHLILAEFNQAVLPRYSRENFPAPTHETRIPVRWQLILAAAVPAMVGAALALTGRWMFAEPYWPSFSVAGILLFGQFAYGLYLIPMNYLVQAAGLPKFSAVASASGAVLILIGILAFGREFGAVGAAWVTAVGFAVMATVALILTRALKLDIRWRSWGGCWPEMALAMAGLVSSAAALRFPVGSAEAHGLAFICIVLAFAALGLTYRRHAAARLRGT